MDEITNPSENAHETSNPDTATAKIEAKPARSERWVRQNRAIRAVCLAKQLDDDTVHELIEGLVGVRSRGDLTEEHQRIVLDYFNGKNRSYPGKPHNFDCPARGPLLRKIEALLADGKLSWAYADGISKRMFKIARVAFCAPEQLGKIVAALIYAAQRRTKKEGGAA